MKTLPNGLVVFNATPHPIRFWAEGWEEPIEVAVDKIISASIEENEVQRLFVEGSIRASLVSTVFKPNVEGYATIEAARKDGAHLIVGSIIAAQAYPQLVVAMTPAPGYERVPPAEKRANPDKFTTF